MSAGVPTVIHLIYPRLHLSSNQLLIRYQRSTKRKLVSQTVACLESGVFLRLWRGKWIRLAQLLLALVPFSSPLEKAWTPPPPVMGWETGLWCLELETRLIEIRLRIQKPVWRGMGFVRLFCSAGTCSAGMDLISYGGWDVGFNDTITGCSTIKTMCQTKKKKKHDSFRKSLVAMLIKFGMIIFFFFFFYWITVYVPLQFVPTFPSPAYYFTW